MPLCLPSYAFVSSELCFNGDINYAFHKILSTMGPMVSYGSEKYQSDISCIIADIFDASERVFRSKAKPLLAAEFRAFFVIRESVERGHPSYKQALLQGLQVMIAVVSMNYYFLNKNSKSAFSKIFLYVHFVMTFFSNISQV